MILSLLIFSKIFPVILDIDGIEGNLRYTLKSMVKEEDEKLEALWGFKANVILKLRIVHFEHRGECIGEGGNYTILVNPEFIDYRSTIRHELMHLYNFEWERRTGIRTPLWIIEGLAMMWENQMARNDFPSLETVFTMWRMDPIRMNEYPEELGEYYRIVHLFMIHLDEKINIFGRFKWLLRKVEECGDWETTLSMILSESIEDFYVKFRLKQTLLFLLNPSILLYIMTFVFILTFFAKIIKLRRRKRKVIETEEESEDHHVM